MEVAAPIVSHIRGKAHLDDVPVEQGGMLSGRAPWVAPITAHGVAIVGPRRGEDLLRQGDGGQERAAFAVPLDGPGVTIEPVTTAALRGLVCGHVTFNGAACTPIGLIPPESRLSRFARSQRGFRRASGVSALGTSPCR